MEAKILLLKKLGGDFPSASQVGEGRGHWWQVGCEERILPSLPARNSHIGAVPALAGKDGAVLTNTTLAF